MTQACLPGILACKPQAWIFVLSPVFTIAEHQRHSHLPGLPQLKSHLKNCALYPQPGMCRYDIKICHCIQKKNHCEGPCPAMEQIVLQVASQQTSQGVANSRAEKPQVLHEVCKFVPDDELLLLPVLIQGQKVRWNSSGSNGCSCCTLRGEKGSCTGFGTATAGIVGAPDQHQ